MIITVCAVTMVLLFLFRRERYNIKMWGLFPLIPYVAFMGILGTKVLYFIENGTWYGQSFFGAVLLFPLFLLPGSLMFRIQLDRLLSYATPPGMAMLAICKFGCFLDGCCGGKVLWYTADGVPVHFPSQLTEMTVAVLLVLLLLFLETKQNMRDKIYPVCLVVYGVSRYILNWFRWERSPFVLNMSAGHFWAVVSVVIGSVWLLAAWGIKAIKNRRAVLGEE